MLLHPASLPKSIMDHGYVLPPIRFFAIPSSGLGDHVIKDTAARQKASCPFGATTKVQPHVQVIINLWHGKRLFQLPSHPSFCFDAHVSLAHPQAFLSSLCFKRAPQMQGCPMTFVFFALARKWHPPLHALHSAKKFLSSWSPWQTIGHATLRLTPPCATRTICIPVWDYPHPSQRLSTPFLMLIANSLFVGCYFIALFWLGPSMCTIPHSPLHTLLSKGRLLSWYITLDIHIMVYNSAVQRFQRPHVHSIMYYSSYTGTRQFKCTISSLSSQAIATKSVQYWGECLACTFYPYHHGLHAHDTRSILSLILLYGVASGEEVSFRTVILQGPSCARTPILSPLICKSCTWSVSDAVMFQAYFDLVTMALVSILFCRMVLPIILAWCFVLRDTTNQTCLPLQESLTACCHNHIRLI